MDYKQMGDRFRRVIRYYSYIFDEIDPENAAQRIKASIWFRGPNAWILAFAIVLASVGLNVNSTAVIIGAMLVSPLMGPIIGAGLALGTNDTDLLKSAGKNLLAMVIISLLASTLFFVLSPLSLVNPTELEARTSPTIYDVLIAFFGGMAGILENSRKERGTVLSGVAIATALMPPLCTAGYGLAHLNLHFFFGALYLFVINSVFIALATFIGVKYLGYPSVSAEPGQRRNLTSRAVALVLLLMIVPSVFSAIDIVRDSNFRIHASRFVEANKSIGKGFIYDYEVSTSSDPSTVTVYLAGEQLTGEERERIYTSAAEHGLFREQVILRDDASTQRDKTPDSEIIKSVLEHSDKQIQALRDSIAILNAKISLYRQLGADTLLTK